MINLLISLILKNYKHISHQTNTAVIALCAVAIIGILVMQSVPVEMQGFDYNTGLSLDTDAVYETHKGQYEPKKGKVYCKAPTVQIGGQDIKREPFYKDKYICSWMPGEYSELITTQCDFDFSSTTIIFLSARSPIILESPAA